MADIFREVDEEVRKDRAKRLWERYGVYVYIVVGALVLGTAANQYWRYYQDTRRLEDSARYQAAAAEAGRRAQDAIDGFARLADTAGTGYAVLSRLREAAARAEAGDVEGAVAAWDRLAADAGADDVYRDLARLLAVMRLVDSAAPDEVRRRLAPLLGADNPWRYHAGELEAVLALREGRRSEAREILRRLSEDAGTPQGTRLRADQLLAALEGQE